MMKLLHIANLSFFSIAKKFLINLVSLLLVVTTFLIFHSTTLNLNNIYSFLLLIFPYILPFHRITTYCFEDLQNINGLSSIQTRDRNILLMYIGIIASDIFPFLLISSVLGILKLVLLTHVFDFLYLVILRSMLLVVISSIAKEKDSFNILIKIEFFIFYFSSGMIPSYLLHKLPTGNLIPFLPYTSTSFFMSNTTLDFNAKVLLKIVYLLILCLALLVIGRNIVAKRNRKVFE